MSTATEVFYSLLTQEHRETEKALDQLKEQLADTKNLNTAQALFKTLSADLDRHFACEEHGLFSVLNQYRTMILMGKEHDMLLEAKDRFTQELAESVSHQQATPGLQGAFHSLDEQLRAHIREEDNGVFPIAKAMLEPEEKALVQRKMAEVSASIGSTEQARQLLKRPEATFKIEETALFKPIEKPIAYEKLFEAEHTKWQHIQLQAGQALAKHWAGEHQCLLVISGQVVFCTELEEQTLSPGAMVTMEPHLLFSFHALSDSHILGVRVWPRPHFIRA